MKPPTNNIQVDEKKQNRNTNLQRPFLGLVLVLSQKVYQILLQYDLKHELDKFKVSKTTPRY